jgi:hypothetical protein
MIWINSCCKDVSNQNKKMRYLLRRCLEEIGRDYEDVPVYEDTEWAKEQRKFIKKRNKLRKDIRNILE